MKKQDIRTFSASELRLKQKRGESQTDLEAVQRMTEAELEVLIEADEDFRNVPKDWHLSARAVRPKKQLSLRLDGDVIDWFKQQGPGYQTKINAVLRTFVEHQPKSRTRG